jgi:shikimate dehydrogenase
VTDRTRLLVLLGDPVDHSLSPTLHNAAIRAAGLNATYVALPVDAELVESTMRAVARAGGGGNVTIPHKTTAARALDRQDRAVEATGACNLFWWEDEAGLCGANSDVPAFVEASEHVLGQPLKDRRVLLLGAGGAARAVAWGCRHADAEQVEILNRTRTRADTLVEELDGDEHIDVLAGPDAVRGRAYDLIVNATSLGLNEGDPMPLDLSAVQADAVLDLVYRPGGTPWVRKARAAGLRAEDGRRMLVLQAAVGFRRWFHLDPPLSVMYEAVGLEARGEG